MKLKLTQNENELSSNDNQNILEYKNCQKKLTDLIIKTILLNLQPLEINEFCKLLKLREIDSNDDINIILHKIQENLDT